MASGVTPEVYDAAVFGSGIAGLTCARRLALAGKSVLLIEKARFIGGHLLPFERKGLTFEVGIHYISDTAPGSAWARACERLEITPKYIPLDEKFEEIRLSDGTTFYYRAPLEAFVADCKDRFPEYSDAIDRYAESIRAIWSVAEGGEFGPDPASMVKALATSSAFRTIIRILPMSIDTFIRKHLGVPHGALYDILTLQHSLIAAPIDEVAALLLLTVAGYYFNGACFVEGGGRKLIEMLSHSAVRYEPHTDARFESVTSRESGLSESERSQLLDQGARYVISAKRFRVFARNVVWTPDPKLIRETSSVRLSRGLRWQLSKVKYPHPVGIGYFATRRPLGDYGIENRNYWPLGSIPTEDVYSETDLVRLASEGPLYVSAGSLRDPGAVPDGNPAGAAGIFQALFLCPPGPEPWGVDDPRYYRVDEAQGGCKKAYHAKKSEVLKALTNRMVREFPALKGELVWKELGTPLTQMRFLNSISGSGYGYAPTVLDVTVARPGFSTGVPGLWLCGAYTKPAHGIATAFMSGLRLAEKLIHADS